MKDSKGKKLLGLTGNIVVDKSKLPATLLPTKKPKELSWLKKKEEKQPDGDLVSSHVQPNSQYSSVHVPLALKQVQYKTIKTDNAPKPTNEHKDVGMIEVILNDRLGKKVRVKCNPDDTIGDMKKLAAAQLGTRHEKIRIQKWYNVYKDHITLEDYEIHDGMGLELYYM